MKHLAAGVLALAACSVFVLPRAPENDIEFVKISLGEFMMGCSPGDIDCKDDERPYHRVQITKPFEIGKYEVTQAQWEAVLGSNPSSINGADRPVETITKTEAQDFVNRLNSRNDVTVTGCRPKRNGNTPRGRAPHRHITESLTRSHGSPRIPMTKPIRLGGRSPTPGGYMTCSVMCASGFPTRYAANYYSNSHAVDPAGLAAAAAARGRPLRGALANLPVMRGGGFDNLAPFLRVSDRYHYYGPTLCVSDVGFRVVRERTGGEQ